MPCSTGCKPDTGEIDYEQVEQPRPGASAQDDRRGLLGVFACARFPRFRAIADEVGALLFVDMAHVAGLVAAGAVSESACQSPMW